MDRRAFIFLFGLAGLCGVFGIGRGLSSPSKFREAMFWRRAEDA